MANRFVRSSKYRHVFGTAYKRELSYDNLKISKNRHDSNMSSVNSKFIAVAMESQGGGAFLVIPANKASTVSILSLYFSDWEKWGTQALKNFAFAVGSVTCVDSIV